MDEPVDYARLGDYLARTRGCPLVPLRERYHSTWLDNSKAKFLLGWRPQVNLERLVDSAWDYQRAADDPRPLPVDLRLLRKFPRTVPPLLNRFESAAAVSLASHA